MSLCVLLYYLRPQKDVTKSFQFHTTRDSKTDIMKIRERLQEAAITTEDKARNIPKFVDPTHSGLDTLCKREWLQKHLASTGYEENLQDEQEQGEIDLDYELSDISYTFH